MAHIDAYFPKDTGSRLALVQSAGDASTVFSFIDFDFPRILSHRVFSMELLVGASWTRFGFLYAMENVWSEVQNDSNRERVTIYISPNQPADGQSPCDVLPEYWDYDIEIISVGIGGLLEFGACDKGVEQRTVPTATSAFKALEEVLFDLYDREAGQCVPEMETPFNGGFSRYVKNVFILTKLKK